MQSQHLVAKNIFAEKIARTPSQVPYQDLTALALSTQLSKKHNKNFRELLYIISSPQLFSPLSKNAN